MNYIKSKASFALSLIAIGVSLYAIIIPKKDTIIQNVDSPQKESNQNQIQLAVNNGYLKWKLSDSSEWINLIKIDDLKGKDGINGTDGKNGINGTDGKDGREVEFRINDTLIEWKYKDENEWSTLFDINDIIKKNQSKKNPIISSLNGSSTEFDCIDNETTCSIGSNIEVRVNDSTTYNFYILGDDGKKLTLILDRNLGEPIAWKSFVQESDQKQAFNKGPIDVLTELNVRTNNWNNINNIEDYNYINSDHTNRPDTYQGIGIENGKTTVVGKDGSIITIEGNTKARLLTLEEAKEFGCNKSTNNSCSQSFIYGNLKAEYGTNTPYGYWLLTTNSTNANNYNVYSIHYTGKLNSTTAFDANNNSRGGRGIRPIITIDKYNKA